MATVSTSPPRQTELAHAVRPSLGARVEVMGVTLLLLCGSFGFSLLLAALRVAWVALTSTDTTVGRVLLVPGKRLVRGEPDRDYRLRLEAIQRLADQASGVVILGGVTGNDAVSEAAAGRDYLRRHALQSVSRIQLEERSTTTFENFRNARELLAANQACAIVSNRYHLARCTTQARSLGLDVVPVAAEQTPRLPPLAWLREAWFFHLYVIGWRWAILRRHRELLGYLD